MQISPVQSNLVAAKQGPIMAGGKIAGRVGAPVQEEPASRSFRSVLADAVQEVETLNRVKDEDALALAAGELDDIGAMMVHAEQAQTAFQMMVQMRNKLVDAYTEILRMNV